VLEAEGFEFLMDTRELWKPPRVLVRGERVEAEVWLDEDDVSFMKEPGLGARDEARILGLVHEHLDDLILAWLSLKDDVRQDRLVERNVLVD